MHTVNFNKHMRLFLCLIFRMMSWLSVRMRLSSVSFARRTLSTSTSTCGCITRAAEATVVAKVTAAMVPTWMGGSEERVDQVRKSAFG